MINDFSSRYMRDQPKFSFSFNDLFKQAGLRLLEEFPQTGLSMVELQSRRGFKKQPCHWVCPPTGNALFSDIADPFLALNTQFTVTVPSPLWQTCQPLIREN